MITDKKIRKTIAEAQIENHKCLYFELDKKSSLELKKDKNLHINFNFIFSLFGIPVYLNKKIKYPMLITDKKTYIIK